MTSVFWKRVSLISALLFIAFLVWCVSRIEETHSLNSKNFNHITLVASTSVLVFREGLEATIVLVAVTAGMTRGGQTNFRRAISLGSFTALMATIVTWFVAIELIAEVNASELALQASTGLLAIIVLLVVMNWFFHKVYWTGWIINHNNRKKRLLRAESDGGRPFWGLFMLGFTAVFREGFEIVLFLQNLRLRAGTALVLVGTGIGLTLTLLTGASVFVANKHLPYKKMLVYTGVMLGVTLLVMVGESVQEMQLAGWVATTSLKVPLPEWLGVWFSVFPNLQSLIAQGLVGLIIIGSYYSARHRHNLPPQTARTERNINKEHTVE